MKRKGSRFSDLELKRETGGRGGGVMETDWGPEGRVIRRRQLPNVCIGDWRYFKPDRKR